MEGQGRRMVMFLAVTITCCAFIALNKVLVIDQIKKHKFVSAHERRSELERKTEAQRKVKTTQRRHLLLTPVFANHTTTSHTYVKRRQQADNVCSVTTGGTVLRMAEHKDTNVAYCVIPKIGCTYWLSVLRWLQQQDRLGRRYSNPFDIPRHRVHAMSPPVHYHTFSSVAKAPRFLSQRFRFMFVREPYSRLWSSYVDKFVLPDFWHLDGRAIARRRPNVTREARRCGHDVTFPEFVTFVTRHDVRSLNAHYQPYHHVCSACLFRPHLIGKMETFAQDSSYVLSRMNLSGIDAPIRGSESRALHEMSMLIQDAFHELRAYAFFRNCTGSTDLARRLWTAFQINGYLPDSLDFPWKEREVVDPTLLKALVRDTYLNRWPKDEGFWRAQKERAMVEAYSLLSDAAMQRLRTLYGVDFLMFGYDPLPDKLYRTRSGSRSP